MELKQLLPICLLLAACEPEQWNDCITSTGAMNSEERVVGDFNTIDLDDRVDLVFEERANGTVRLEAGSNLIAQVTTDVVDGTLKVRNEMRCNWVRSFKPRITVHVPVSEASTLVLRGAGNVSCTDTIARAGFNVEQWGGEGSVKLLLKVQTCSIALHTAAGDVTLAGTCSGQADLFSGIMAAIDASAMRTRLVVVNNSGVADIRCWATEQLDVQILDDGDVYYRGDPSSVHSTISGPGRLIHE